MSKTASYVKDRYNKKTYDRYTFYLRKDEALNNYIQADKETTPVGSIVKDALSIFYREKQQQTDPGRNTRQKAEKSPTLTAKRQRRAAMKKVILQLQQIKDAEETSHDNTPENLQGSPAYEAAEECINSLEEALEILESAY